VRDRQARPFDLPHGSGYGFRLVARATSTDASVTVPAGTFDGCLLVVEATIELAAFREGGGR
jgi:hypothetical protein